MVPVEQRRLWRPDDHPAGPQRGDCVAACLASIFELPYEDCADAIGTSQSIFRWTRERFPGVEARIRVLRDVEQPDRLGGHLEWPTRHHERGHWLAAVWSPRIPDREMRGCGCASRVPRGDPGCEWCHGNPDSRFLGIEWGLHMVVMHNWEVAWDPHPARETGATLYFDSAVTWHVVDPARLVGYQRGGLLKSRAPLAIGEGCCAPC